MFFAVNGWGFWNIVFGRHGGVLRWRIMGEGSEQNQVFVENAVQW